MVEGGFGYDPLFQPIGYNCSMGQIPAEEKNCISHRYKALIQFVEFFSK
jgi:XTP/dITP diphosphohydrolase